ncbi:hypothetical protein GM418_10985 [Maribellus comscasis]|uniref:Uncharacterized protein n=1 Tax=Maribellus comscasis TaxID=2681766 RepID=A0A6I6K2M1_9BACT|nr:hypothetical protein [Maribellus comscasis]QGY44164.1 hypothetical protein GM418_10985 [Maribellus comscasis]
MEKPPHFREVWLYLLLTANHAENRVSGRVIKRGQTLTDYNEIIQALSWSGGKPPRKYTKTNIQVALRYLERSGMIIKTKSTKKIIVTIKNYDVYQSLKDELVHDESTINPETIHDKSTDSPNHKQEERNKKENTYVPDFFEFKNIVDEIQEEENQALTKSGVIELFKKLEEDEWSFFGGDSFNNRAHLKKYLVTLIIRAKENQKETIKGSSRFKNLDLRIPNNMLKDFENDE